jgi:hypothetical protein
MSVGVNGIALCGEEQDVFLEDHCRNNSEPMAGGVLGIYLPAVCGVVTG